MPRRQGFTLLEIIIVIAVILILMGMVVVGMQYLGASSRAKSTAVTLANLSSLLAELEATGNLAKLQQGAVEAENLNDPDTRINLPAVIRTREAMSVLRSVPSNRTAMDQLPTSLFYTFDRSGDGTDPMRDVPILLDAWGNPIIFVPPPYTGGGSVVWDDRYGLVGVNVADGPSNVRVVNPGGVDVDGTLYPADGDIARLKYLRPFWVSAGPDGNLKTHDDNIYSFEN